MSTFQLKTTKFLTIFYVTNTGKYPSTLPENNSNNTQMEVSLVYLIGMKILYFC